MSTFLEKQMKNNWKMKNVKHITCLERKPEKTINSKQETWLAFKKQQVSQEI